MAKGKVTAPQVENGANGSTIGETSACAMADIESSEPAAQSRDFTVMCPSGPPSRW
ncbi:hypothetical protein [Ralstonia soli]|uniref:Uncharacterized protein n=1 Tax=Ralstonia soli TaxID=2953896 RepID=A0ABT1AFT6_9RALS|nr:hypothetical protein [Ralstonia soli]MCO5397260.1 hypothetical protein [Ralstonia soli]